LVVVNACDQVMIVQFLRMSLGAIGGSRHYHEQTTQFGGGLRRLG
jgi:hypothetical protein